MDRTDKLKMLGYIGVVGLVMVAFFGGLVYFITSSASEARAERAQDHETQVVNMTEVVRKAQERCSRLKQAAHGRLHGFNPFAGSGFNPGVPLEVYGGHDKDYVRTLNQGYRSLEALESPALMIIEGNLFPLRGMCGKRLTRVADGLERYGPK